jgi:predicted nucleic acid-binding protein
LVDTSVWIDHLRIGSRRLSELLEDGLVLMHPLVVGELACGPLARRDEILTWLRVLPAAPVVEHDEVLEFVRRRRLYGQGIGWLDAHLLASARLAASYLWTLDRPLHRAALALRLAP